ncbi:MAG: phosphate/phosphite/phosphonate ABC transporter substrate-binding protein [Planctomycetota bacterium]|nr:phosphate/phosphite/phosphonate ABC transporter substrate-binding protein [Planctomycetota bacterium]
MTSSPVTTHGRLLHVTLTALMALAAGCSDKPQGGGAAEAPERAAPPASAALPRLTLGVVPQQSASKLAAQWGPLLKLVGERAGVDLVFKTATDIPEFEARCREGLYDFAYMNPYHYTVFHEVGYEAIAKRANAQIKGIIVKKRGAAATALADLRGEAIAFPAPRAFAATLLTTAGLKNAGVAFTPKYVQSHDSVYMNVARGKYAAGGGIVRTLKSVDDAVRSQLEIMWETPGYTPHAFAAHRRVDAGIRRAVTDALVALAGDEGGRELLAPLKMEAIEPAANSDWDDVRALNIQVK